MPVFWIVKHHPEPGDAPELWLCSDLGRAKARAKRVAHAALGLGSMPEGDPDRALALADFARAEAEIEAWSLGDAETSYDGSGRVLAHTIVPDDEEEA